MHFRKKMSSGCPVELIARKLLPHARSWDIRKNFEFIPLGNSWAQLWLCRLDTLSERKMYLDLLTLGILKKMKNRPTPDSLIKLYGINSCVAPPVGENYPAHTKKKSFFSFDFLFPAEKTPFYIWCGTKFLSHPARPNLVDLLPHRPRQELNRNTRMEIILCGKNNFWKKNKRHGGLEEKISDIFQKCGTVRLSFPTRWILFISIGGALGSKNIYSCMV